jgi:hypothetical protein
MIMTSQDDAEFPLSYIITLSDCHIAKFSKVKAYIPSEILSFKMDRLCIDQGFIDGSSHIAGQTGDCHDTTA